jgi:hypothetical protein
MRSSSGAGAVTRSRDGNSPLWRLFCWRVVDAGGRVDFGFFQAGSERPPSTAYFGRYVNLRNRFPLEPIWISLAPKKSDSAVRRERFVRRYPGSVYTDRIDADCGPSRVLDPGQGR